MKRMFFIITLYEVYLFFAISYVNYIILTLETIGPYMRQDGLDWTLFH